MDWWEIRTVDPGESNEDLRPFLDLVGDARVVGLGECTHGSSEIHRLKHRLVRLLVEELGFSALVFEANLAETIRSDKPSTVDGWRRTKRFLLRTVTSHPCVSIHTLQS